MTTPVNLLKPVERVDEPGFVSRLFRQIQSLIDGRIASMGTVTLTANVATTTVDNPLFEPQQAVALEPTTANAAAEKGAGTMYVSAKTKGQFTITHANNAQTDRTFDYLFLG